MARGSHIYFISDAHLGTPDHARSLVRERKLVALLDEIADDAAEIYFLGDLFDFWFEYKRVVPRGFTRLLGTIARMSDAGVIMHFFTGNHDIWAFDYLPLETGMVIHRKPVTAQYADKRFFLAHGDDLDESDVRFRVIKSFFTNGLMQWAFARLHPNFALWIAHSWSRRSREAHGDEAFKGEEEAIVKYARRHLLEKGYDYLVFGHRHCPVDYRLNDETRLIILGDWMKHFTYARFNGTDLQLLFADANAAE